jgi:hypothetical protein
LGSFGFVSKLTSALVPSGWLAQLGSFGISRLCGKGRSISGVTMADCAPYRLQSKRSATGIEEDARPVTELGVRGPRDSHLPQAQQASRASNFRQVTDFEGEES